VIWPLPISELVEMILFQVEVCASILECESATLMYYFTSESGITGVEGDSLTLLISNGEVHGVGVGVSRTPRLVSRFMLIFVTINLSLKTTAFLRVSDKSILN
jgi:hypothetical protein